MPLKPVDLTPAWYELMRKRGFSPPPVRPR